MILKDIKKEKRKKTFADGKNIAVKKAENDK